MNAVTIQTAAAMLRERDNILLLTHRRPDGDTTGSAAGLCAALRGIGKCAYLLPNPEMTAANRTYAAPYWAPEGFAPEFVVSVDIAARSLFYPAAEAYFDRIGLAIDHHPSFEGFGAASCVDPSAAACGEIVYEICREQAKADREDRKVVSQTVTMHTEICPECGKAYVSGGTTRTVTKADTENDFQQDLARQNDEENKTRTPFSAVA